MIREQFLENGQALRGCSEPPSSLRLRLAWLGIGIGGSREQKPGGWLPRGPEERWARFPARGDELRVFGWLCAKESRWLAESLELPCRGAGRTFERAKRELAKSLSSLHSDELRLERRGCRKAEVVVRYYIQLLEPLPWERADVMTFPALSAAGELLYSPVRDMLARLEGPIRLEREPERAWAELIETLRLLGIPDEDLTKLSKELAEHEDLKI